MGGGGGKKPKEAPPIEIPPTPAPAPAPEPTASTPSTVSEERNSVLKNLLLKNRNGAGSLRIDRTQPTSANTGLNVPG